MKLASAFAVAVLLAGSMACASAPVREPVQTPGVTPGEPAAAPSLTIAPFSSNGCSGFREARFFSCCYTHDLAYWAGGTFRDRTRSDRAVRRCLIDISHDRVLGDFSYFLVLLWTVPATVGFKDGWGRAWYGLEPKRGHYDPLTPVQRQLVSDETARLCSAMRLNPKTGRYRIDDTRDAWREIRPAEAR